MEQDREDKIARVEVDPTEWFSSLNSSSRSRLILRDMEVFGGFVSREELFFITPTVEEASAAFASNECIAWFSTVVDFDYGILDGRADRVVGGVKTVDIVIYPPGILSSIDNLKGPVDIVEDAGLDVYSETTTLDTYSVLDDFDDVDLLTMHTVLKRRLRAFGFSERLPDKHLRFLFKDLFDTTVPSRDKPKGRHIANRMTKIYGNYFALGFTFDLLLDKLIDGGYNITEEDLVRVWVLDNSTYEHIVQVAREIIGKELERLTGVNLLF